MNEHRACNLVGVRRRVLRYRSPREGMTPYHKKLRGIYREENLRVRR